MKTITELLNERRRAEWIERCRQRGEDPDWLGITIVVTAVTE